MNMSDFTALLNLSTKWKKDRFGHYKRIIKDANGEDIQLRFKIQKISVRLEKNITRQDGTKEWYNISSTYYKDIVHVRGSVYLLGKSGMHVAL